MGWPDADNYTGPGKVQAAFKSNLAQEEIHNNAMLLEGALWYVYTGIRESRDDSTSRVLMTKLVLEAIGPCLSQIVSE